MTKPNKSHDMRDQLRNLMSQHAAAVNVSPPSRPSSPNALLVPQPSKVQTPPLRRMAELPLEKPAQQSPDPRASASTIPPPTPHPVSRTIPHADRCTVRLTGPELATVNRLILETHQRTGERITSTDVLRIALARVGAGSAIVASEIQALRTTDGRRINYRG